MTIMLSKYEIKFLRFKLYRYKTKRQKTFFKRILRVYLRQKLKKKPVDLKTVCVRDGTSDHYYPEKS